MEAGANPAALLQMHTLTLFELREEAWRVTNPPTSPTVDSDGGVKEEEGGEGEKEGEGEGEGEGEVEGGEGEKGAVEEGEGEVEEERGEGESDEISDAINDALTFLKPIE